MLIGLSVGICCVLILIGPTVSASPIRVACVGDSITKGDCSDKTHGYPAVLQSLLGSDFQVSNFGVDARTMLTNGLCGPPASDNCSYVATSSYSAALASRPDIVTIMLGTNDAKFFNWYGVQGGNDQYGLDYIQMIQAFQALTPTPVIYICTLVPLYGPYPYEMDRTVINQLLSPLPGGLIAKIAKLARVNGVIDIHGDFVEKGFTSDITCDGCHPLDEGYEEIASVMAPVLWEAGLSLTRETPDTGVLASMALPPLKGIEEVRQMYETKEYERMANKVNEYIVDDDSVGLRTL